MRTVFISALFCLLPLVATAQDTPAQDANAISISADGKMVWNRQTLSFSVEGNASATQGDMTLNAQKISADYARADDPGDIRLLTATGNVVIMSKPYTIHADRAVYDTQKSLATITGAHLRVTSPDATLTAQKEIVFDRRANTLTAHGGARIVRADQELQADAIAANFSEGADKKLVLNGAAATGHVVLTSPRATARADSGRYDPKTGTATLNGNVVIKQDENLLEGTEATMNMATGLSQITAGTGRVKATFYPKKKTP